MYFTINFMPGSFSLDVVFLSATVPRVYSHQDSHKHLSCCMNSALSYGTWNAILGEGT